ncbi:NAD-dependent succinate-semialdehyde dehydrogenase [Pelagibius sp. Alg239-R121]|uniref:NAD-dependent succinate-semialdehyde dehydrogenase n=1 Tax=Pelagibius sp. Alg239-R121 TaxID=2993448 RepID=UPI0024A63EA4|nr:NAD-dependent succinate-semialdehyde dehydrogenase [Pelagibius sp. Alg239-R121]
MAVQTASISPDQPHELDLLADPSLLRAAAYIGGAWMPAADGTCFPVRDPATGGDFQQVANCGAEETRKAIDAAARAFSAWRSTLPQERAALLRAWHEAILAAREDLAILMTLEQGKPLEESRGEIDYAASFVEWYAEEAKRTNVESIASHLPNAEMSLQRVPVGVAGIVTPWNFPSAMVTRKAAAALAAGCTVVAHPSSWTPLSALALAALADRVGFPAGLFNVVTGDAERIVGMLCDDTRVRALSFTGSTEIGRLLAARCAKTMKQLVMELGGHAPLIVFDDADLKKAVEIAVPAKFATSGQDCLAANRIYVQRKLYPAFCAAFAGRSAALRVGRGFQPEAAIGPLMHERAIEKLEDQVADALAQGARCLTGGKRDDSGPLFYQPTVLADVPDSARIMSEETFGPVAAIVPFDSETEVITRANDSEYGLAAYLITQDQQRIRRMREALEVGMIAVNRVKLTGAPVPFGGIKQSGLGREGSRHGMEAFTELKYCCIDAA